MKRRRKPTPEPWGKDVDAALAAMKADELRDLLREMMLEIGDRALARVASSIVSRAARGSSGWVPEALDDSDVAEAVAFAEAAKRVGYAEPSDVDERLRRGAAAFLARDYAVAHRIFGALLRPIAEAEIDLGQHEMIDEVLGVDANECATQYVVSAYMTSAPGRRAEAVRAAIDEVGTVGYFSEPIKAMERAAVEALPGLDDFLSAWRVIVEKEAAADRRGDWDIGAPRWLREVAKRIEGSGGLANVARSSKSAADLRAWCETLVEAGDWKSALSAFEEAADLVTDRGYARAEFLDGAALAVRELGEKDVSPWLERAWRAEPTMLRLRRWVGSACNQQSIRERSTDALNACPTQALRQRAFLHLLRGEMEQAAKLLAGASGLGWSSQEHPGHLLFPVFHALLAGNRAFTLAEHGMDMGELEMPVSDRDEPREWTPEVGEILRNAGVDGLSDAKARKAVLAAMRRAAERRVAGVTEEKRRRHYGHAASLVATCVACDASPEASRWAARLREEYRRFSALRAELDQHRRTA